MSYQYFIVDAFTEAAFGGVPVAVFPDTSDVPHALYATLASEMVAADTVFISRITEGERYEFQFFGPLGAARPGAHTLLAGLGALVQAGELTNTESKKIKIDTVDDCIEVHYDPSTPRNPILMSQLLTPEVDSFVPPPAELAKIIGLDESDIASSKYSSLIVSCGQPYLIVPIKSYHAIREAAFHRSHWASSSLPQSLVDKILLFAPNTDGAGADFHSRLLENNGKPAGDPAVGEVMPAFAAYLCQQSHVSKGTHSFTVRRGANNARQSHLHIEMDNVEEKSLKIRIGGAAVATSKAEILV